ncbi:hypothetical protein BEWA_027970 [Theileria equi strain WA]|uniref:Thioredoxin domain-containing protein n=1 Tax=Theileria equi strain WA TaxID=1537102 RepID=L0AXI7_THEEQ|nr:hypothetical protein BEWA_027970 [Theileria equi strain WA]AFZ79948.1 hypothetical protein BEWA_027970 [Theileria equi strain WA]|eukprot:XP_004829614.1 hypothetical protein BEWA_027970 [Theileria equi strain WA]
MVGNKTELTQMVKENVMNLLLEKEHELDEMIHDYSVMENKLAKERDEETLEDLRAARLRQLQELHSKRQEYLRKGHGNLTEIHSDKGFFEACRGTDSVVVHFYRPTTARCGYLDSHLIKVAESHFDTKFIKVNVEKTPFICERFKIWCLPTLMIIKNGKTDHSIIGFDEFGGDGFSTETLIKVLEKHGIKSPK